MDADIFIPVTLGSKRFHHKHLREINGKPFPLFYKKKVKKVKKRRSKSKSKSKK